MRVTTGWTVQQIRAHIDNTHKLPAGRERAYREVIERRRRLAGNLPMSFDDGDSVLARLDDHDDERLEEPVAEEEYVDDPVDEEIDMVDEDQDTFDEHDDGEHYLTFFVRGAIARDLLQRDGFGHVGELWDRRYEEGTVPASLVHRLAASFTARGVFLSSERRRSSPTAAPMRLTRADVGRAIATLAPCAVAV